MSFICIVCKIEQEDSKIAFGGVRCKDCYNKRTRELDHKRRHGTHKIESQEGEKWVPIEDGKYYISNYGRVKTLTRANNIEKIIKSRIIRSTGYLTTSLVLNSGRKWVFIHRLIADHFIPNPNKLPQVNHKNGIKTDNRIENLEWVTAKENINHAHSIGIMRGRPGECNPNTKLTDIQAMEVFLSQEIPINIAIKYNISRSIVYAIKSKRSWRHIHKTIPQIKEVQ